MEAFVYIVCRFDFISDWILGMQGKYVGEGSLASGLCVVRFRKPTKGTGSVCIHTTMQLSIVLRCHVSRIWKYVQPSHFAAILFCPIYFRIILFLHAFQLPGDAVHCGHGCLPFSPPVLALDVIAWRVHPIPRCFSSILVVFLR